MSMSHADTSSSYLLEGAAAQLATPCCLDALECISQLDLISAARNSVQEWLLYPPGKHRTGRRARVGEGTTATLPHISLPTYPWTMCLEPVALYREVAGGSTLPSPPYARVFPPQLAEKQEADKYFIDHAVGSQLGSQGPVTCEETY